MQIKRANAVFDSCAICDGGTWPNKSILEVPADRVLIHADDTLSAAELTVLSPIMLHVGCFKILHTALGAITADLCSFYFEDIEYRVEVEFYSQRLRVASCRCCICGCYSQLDSSTGLSENFVISDVTSSAGTKFGVHRTCHTDMLQSLQNISAHEVLSLLKI